MAPRNQFRRNQNMGHENPDGESTRRSNGGSNNSDSNGRGIPRGNRGNDNGNAYSAKSELPVDSVLTYSPHNNFPLFEEYFCDHIDSKHGGQVILTSLTTLMLKSSENPFNWSIMSLATEQFKNLQKIWFL